MSTINLLETIDREFATPYSRVRQNDVTVNPFKAYRTWTFYSGSDSSYVTPLRAIHVDGLPAISSSVPFNDATNPNGSYQFIIYDSLDHLFYRRADQPYNTFGQNNAERTTKILFKSASVFSIPVNWPSIGDVYNVLLLLSPVGLICPRPLFAPT